MQKKWKQLLACLAAPLAALWGLIVWTVTLFRRVRPAADWAAGAVSPLGQLYRLSQRRDLAAELEVEAVAADGLLIGAAGVDPHALRQRRSVKVQGGADDVFSVQHPARRLHGLGGGRFVNLTVAHRLKLNGVLPIENDPLDSVWETGCSPSGSGSHYPRQSVRSWIRRRFPRR